MVSEALSYNNGFHRFPIGFIAPFKVVESFKRL